jgi:hypothetical protein
VSGRYDGEPRNAGSGVQGNAAELELVLTVPVDGAGPAHPARQSPAAPETGPNPGRTQGSGPGRHRDPQGPALPAG